ncbi:MAG: archaetidylserine decarboxylase [Wenzhouxiangellaceae bacterium]
MHHSLDHLFAAVQNLVPQRGLTRLANRVARIRAGWLKNFMIRAFAETFDINWQEAARARPEDYPTFNAFFTRELKPGSRPLPADPNALIAPCDGAISEMGNIEEQSLLQAKGIDYRLPALLGGDDEWSQHYWNGAFATIYLSPRDYHRIHMPLSGQLLRTRHIPGSLFSVNDASARTIPGLFTRNERLVCRFRGELGEFTVILVGAMLVAGIETVWDGEIEGRRDGDITDIDHQERQIHLRRGEELGRFNYGSTVILLFPTRPFQRHLENGAKVRLGLAL